MNRTKAIRAAMTAATLALALSLCVSALALYGEGTVRRNQTGSLTEPIFTREAVARQLKRLSPFAGVWLAAAVAAVITGTLEPSCGSAARAKGSAVPRRMRGTPETGRRAALRVGLYALAALMLALGVLNGGLNDVLVKAINICTECIGLG